MSLDRPGAGGDEQDDEFTEVLDSAAAPRRPGGSPACEPWCDCGRRAAWPGLLPPEGHDGQNGTRSRARPGIGWSAHQPGRPPRGWQAAAPAAATLPE
ncbi:MAG TPA: hypothetical protein VFO01_07355 [Trebonia sp.]|nr:hypothetical protein [Trebonia sp.]